jgi:hypothetical protein
VIIAISRTFLGTWISKRKVLLFSSNVRMPANPGPNFVTEDVLFGSLQFTITEMESGLLDLDRSDMSVDRFMIPILLESHISRAVQKSI